MFKGQLHGVLVLVATSALACVAGVADDVPTTGDEIADDSGDDITVSESALVSPPKRCERMTFALSPLTPRAPAVTASVPGPYLARITNVGKEISCSSSTTGTLSTNIIWREVFQAPFVGRQDGRGRYGVPQLAPAGAGELVDRARIRGPGSPVLGPDLEHRLHSADDHPDHAWFPGSSNVRLHDGASGPPPRARLGIQCQAHIRGPVSSIRARPSDLISAGGDRFTYVCDLAAAQRRSACSAGICTIQCTANVTAPIDTAGISQCINSCADRCAATPCAPVLCTGSDCPSSSCAPANVCTTNAQCGAGRECGGSGCCITIIR